MKNYSNLNLRSHIVRILLIISCTLFFSLANFSCQKRARNSNANLTLKSSYASQNELIDSSLKPIAERILAGFEILNFPDGVFTFMDSFEGVEFHEITSLSKDSSYLPWVIEEVNSGKRVLYEVVDAKYDKPCEITLYADSEQVKIFINPSWFAAIHDISESDLILVLVQIANNLSVPSNSHKYVDDGVDEEAQSYDVMLGNTRLFIAMKTEYLGSDNERQYIQLMILEYNSEKD